MDLLYSTIEQPWIYAVRSPKWLLACLLLCLSPLVFYCVRSPATHVYKSRFEISEMTKQRLSTRFKFTTASVLRD